GRGAVWPDFSQPASPKRTTISQIKGILFTALERTPQKMRSRKVKLSLIAAFVASLAIPLAAEELKTTSDTIPRTTVKIDLVQLPAGKVTVGGKEYDIKPVW